VDSTTTSKAPEKAAIAKEKSTNVPKDKPVLSPKKVELVYGDIIMDKTAAGMKAGDVEAVLFPHWFHRIRFRCKVCHEDVFKTEKGGNDVNMDAISAGESCGMCHDGAIATNSLECESCHFYPLPNPEPVVKEPTEDLKNLLFAGRSGKIAGKGDQKKQANGAHKWGSGWQPKALTMPGLPKDKFGLIDWVKLTRDGIALPKGSIDPNDPNYESAVHYEYDENGDSDIEDILINAKSETLPDVVFPHTLHTWWLNCKSCHPSRFVRTAGDTKMTMKEMSKGKYCGVCHGNIAFPLEDCARCHDKEKEIACRKSDNCISK
ncbi:MAG: hypothetical protein OEY89_11395, partial [Gammaproteobacteria bacterium]|nr:hypothetical protein [Gammaproteobacteria bacterium]